MSDETDKDVAFIQALADILRTSDLSEIEVEREFAKGSQLKVHLARATALPPTVMPAVAPAAIARATGNPQTRSAVYRHVIPVTLIRQFLQSPGYR